MPYCKTCGAEFVWCKTEMGKWIPVDRFCDDGGNILVDKATDTAIVVDPMTTEYSGILHTSHFVTCPDSDRHRKDAA